VQGHLQKFRGADQIEAAVASVSNLGRIADAEGASTKVGGREPRVLCLGREGRQAAMVLASARLP
jgi:hypothetical protein